jgi:hypothetical protein
MVAALVPDDPEQHAQGRQDSNLQPAVLETAALPIAPLPYGSKTNHAARSANFPEAQAIIVFQHRRTSLRNNCAYVEPASLRTFAATAGAVDHAVTFPAVTLNDPLNSIE